MFCDVRATDYKNCAECADRRAQATCAMAVACPGLKCCRWNDGQAAYWFKVDVCREGEVLVKVESEREIKPSHPLFWNIRKAQLDTK